MSAVLRGWLSVAQAASALGVSPGRVRQLAASGQLPARRFGRAWVIRRADLERYRVLPEGVKGSPRRLNQRRSNRPATTS